MHKNFNSHYPSYDILSQQEHWDQHTREIVKKRLGPFPAPSHFNPEQAKIIKWISKTLVADERDNILEYIVFHLEQGLKSSIGEGQRPPGAPPQHLLLREGLKKLRDFCQLEENERIKVLKSLEHGELENSKHFINYLKRKIISAYYSHPLVWSEIGYGGPAYPRGYVRIELGLTDPWEAQKDGK